LRKGLKYHKGIAAPAKKDRTMSGFCRRRPMAREAAQVLGLCVAAVSVANSRV
jgi:hypothetical protein